MPSPPRDMRLNKPALVALVCGALGCVPGLGVVAIVAGWLGLRKSRDPVYGAGKLAVFGIMLGVVTTVLSTSLYVGVAQTWLVRKQATPVVAAQAQFLQLIAAGNTRSARALCTDRMTDDRVRSVADHIYDMGSLQRVENWFDGQRFSGDRFRVGTELLSVSRREQFDGTWVRDGDAWRLDDASFKPLPPDPATQPAATAPAK